MTHNPQAYLLTNRHFCQIPPDPGEFTEIIGFTALLWNFCKGSGGFATHYRIGYLVQEMKSSEKNIF